METRELTIDQAKVKMDEMWQTIETDEARLTDRVSILSVQFRLMALTNDRIQSANFRFDAEMDAFYAKRNGDQPKADECAAYIDMMNARIDYDRAETAAINAEIGA